MVEDTKTQLDLSAEYCAISSAGLNQTLFKMRPDITISFGFSPVPLSVRSKRFLVLSSALCDFSVRSVPTMVVVRRHLF